MTVTICPDIKWRTRPSSVESVSVPSLYVWLQPRIFCDVGEVLVHRVSSESPGLLQNGCHCWVPTTTFDIEGNDPNILSVSEPWDSYIVVDGEWLWHVIHVTHGRFSSSDEIWRSGTQPKALSSYSFGGCFVGTSHVVYIRLSIENRPWPLLSGN